MASPWLVLEKKSGKISTKYSAFRIQFKMHQLHSFRESAFWLEIETFMILISVYSPFSIAKQRRLIWQLFGEQTHTDTHDRVNCSIYSTFFPSIRRCVYCLQMLNGRLILLDTGQKWLMDIWSLKLAGIKREKAGHNLIFFRPIWFIDKKCLSNECLLCA